MSQRPIKLYAFAVSPYVNKVAAVLDYKKLSYESIFVHPQKKSEIGFSTKKLVPILDDDGTIVEDSSDIVLYLEERYPDPPALQSGARLAHPAPRSEREDGSACGLLLPQEINLKSAVCDPGSEGSRSDFGLNLSNPYPCLNVP